jgi:signal peptidase II
VAADVHSERETTDSTTADAGLDGAGAGVGSGSGAADGGAAAAAGAEPAGSAETAPKGRRRIVALLLVAAAALLIDVVSKLLVVAHLSDRDPVRLPGGFLRLTLIRNSGAAFSIGESQTWMFTIIAAAVVVVVLRISRNLRSLAWACALGLLLGGALGNLSDRIFRSPGLFRGHVVDFLQFPRFPVVNYDFPVFNLADSAIVVGGCLMVLLSFLGRQPDGTRHTKGAATEVTTPEQRQPGADA